MTEVKKEATKSFFEKLHLMYVTPILGIVTAIYSFGFTVRKDKLEEATTQINNIKTETDTKINELSFRQELKFKLYKEVKDALDKKSEENDKLVTLMVYSMLDSTDIDFQKSLLALLSSKQSKSIDTIINKNIAFNNGVKNRILDNTGNKMKIDIFYLDDIISESKVRAEKIQSLLNNMNKGYSVRLRLLPKTVNLQSGYRIDSNQIRFEKGTDEEGLSKELIEFIKSKKVFPLEQLIPHPVNNKTPNYISIFVRNM